MAKILIVDDDRDLLQACESVLAGKGYNVETSDNAQEAEEMVEKADYDLIILDIMMEQADDGIALARRLKKKGVKSPIVMLSGISKVTGYEYGRCDETLPCVDFLEKPLKPETLVNKVAEVLKEQ